MRFALSAATLLMVAVGAHVQPVTLAGRFQMGLQMDRRMIAKT